MSLIRWQPLRELETLRHQMNQLFDGMVHSESASQFMSGSWAPAIEVKETDTEVVVRAEVPGIDAKDLDVQVMENAVSIIGKHEEETKGEDKGRVWSELRYGQFKRWIPLPTVVNHEQVKADFKHGILTLTLPKVEAKQQSVVKLNLEEQLRETVAQQRQAEDLREQTVHRRAEDALGKMQASDLDEAAREAVTEDRQHENHIQETAHMRAATSEG